MLTRGAVKLGGLDSQDQLLKSVEIILTVKAQYFFVMVKIFESRYGCLEIFIKTNQHFQDFSIFVETL